MANNNLTRIQNNQITDGTIQGGKIASGTLTGNLLASTVTFNSNITILGNLTVSNSYTQLNSINTYINDPIVVFNNGYTGSLTGYDIGILVNRNSATLAPYGSVNTFFGWVEADGAFEAIATTETGTNVSSINNSGYANVKIGNLTAVSGSFSGAVTALSVTTPTLNATNGNITTLYTANFNTANAVITGGSVNNTVIGNTTPAVGSFTTLNATTGFSTANAVISGGYISALSNATITTAVVTNFSSGNAVITGGSVNGTAIGASSASTGAFTTLTSSGVLTSNGNIVAASGTASTNTTTGALVIVGGLGVSGAEWIGSTLNVAGATTLQSTLGVTGVTTLSTATAGGLQAQAIGNVTPGTATFTTETVGGLQAQAIGNVTPGTATFTTETVGGLQAQAIGNVTPGTGNFTTLQATNFSSGNAVISGGYISALSNATITSGTLTTLVATNFSSGNARVTGGYADNFAIGANTAATGAFTTLTASGATTVTNSTQSTTSSTGALVVTGGVGVAKNLNVGGDALISGNLTVQGSLTAIQSQTLDVSDLNITVAKGASTAAAANGAGITVDGASATLLYTSATDSWNVNKQLIGLGATLSNSTVSTNTTTGALVVTGGVGIGGALNVGGTLSAGTASFASINNTPIGNATPSTGVFTTLQSTTSTATNFSSGNARVTGGYADNFPIGANTAATGAFTTLTTSSTAIASGNIVAASGTASTSTTTGALVVAGTGGIGIGGNINAGVFNTSLHNIKGNLLLGQGSVVDSADSILTINLNTDTPIVSNATVHMSATTNKNAIYGADSFGTGVLSLVVGRHARGTSTSPTAVQAFDNIAGYYGRGYGATGYVAAGTPAAGLVVQAAENYTDSAQGATLNLLIVPTGSITSTLGMSISGASGNVLIPSTTTSTNAATGSLVTMGGAGIGGALNVNGTSTHTGVGTFNANLVAASSTASTSTTTGALVVVGGVGVSGNATIGGDTVITGDVYVQGGDIWTSATTFNVVNATATTVNFAGAATTLNTGNASGTTNMAGVTKHLGNVVAASGTASTSTTTGALVVAGGAGISGAVNIGGNATIANATTFNTAQAAGMDTVIKGVNDATLIWARPNATYDQVIIGNSATASTAIRGAKLIINSTDSLLIPAGTNAQRPGNAGGTDTSGMLRFNTTSNGMEIYNGTAWQSFSTSFTVIADQQFTGTGSQTAFTLSTAQTTASCIVSINGVLQIPTLAYAVSSTTLTFTEAPAATDIIDVRCLTTTSTVTSLASTNGYNSFTVDNYGANVYVGSSGTTLAVSWNSAGAQVGFLANTSVASANTATTIDTIDNTQYRSAKYLVQVTNGANYQVQEVLVISNGTTATSVTYGTLQTNGNLGVVQTTQSGTNTLVQFIATNATNNVRISKDYLVI